ncbi:hypothetical protein ACFL3H_08140 [Gemmatimonadota bacterium]
MKMLSAALILIVGAHAGAPAVLAQTMVIAEGYSAAAVIPDSAAQSAFESLRRQNPAATLAEARLAVAQRGARVEALRNAAEFLNGIDFEFTGGSFERKMTARTSGSIQPGGCTYRTLESGLVVASLELPATEEIRGQREGLPQYEVTGNCEDESMESVVMAMRQARMDAVEKAVRQAIRDRDPRAQGSNRVFSGTVYILRTVEDTPGIPYRVIMVVQVRLDR